MRKKPILLFVILIGLALVSSSAAAASSSVMVGIYPSHDLQSDIDELTKMDAWLAGNPNFASKLTIAGDFISITFNNNPYPAWNNVIPELDAAWDNGYIPFVNLMPSKPSEGQFYDTNCDQAIDIVEGRCDSKLNLWADLYKQWAGTTKMAYIAPLPEANGDWTLYHSNGSTFKQAFYRIQARFAARGVPASAVKWVFAPNGWHDSNQPYRAFENYYPGNDFTDVVAFSSYNYGGCPADTPYRKWTDYAVGFEPYLVRMTAMAPSKPIFIAQTGTVNVPEDTSDPTQNKSDWIREVFSALADYPGLQGIIYFNKSKAEGLPNCPNTNYLIFNEDTRTGEPGIVDIMRDPRFSADYVFADVRPAPTGMSNVWYYDAVHTLYDNAITSGCSQDPLMLYCPDNPVTRAEMAVFLLNALGISPGPLPGLPSFSDTSGHWAEAYIEELKNQGITGGCSSDPPLYCPDTAVTRAQMAVFLLKGIGVIPPAMDGSHPFNDIGSHWAEIFIEELSDQNITGGCSSDPPLYCPDTAVTRAQMAVFLIKAFNLE